MKVLQINSVCGIGSTGRIATDIHNILIKQGHESYIAFGKDLPRNCNNTIKIGTKFDNYYHVAKTRVFDKHGFGSVQATHRFIEKVKEIDPDIIHLHNIHGYYINIEVLFNYLKEANKPVIWTLHDCWSFTGHCASFDYVGCDRWRTGCHDCPQKNVYPRSFFFDHSKKNYEKKKELFTSLNNMVIVNPSQWLTNLVKESYLNKYTVKMINNGIDLDVFKPTESDFRERYGLQDKFIILGVANVWGERKGFQYFLELADRLDDSYRIVLVGLTEAQKKKLPKNIFGITRTSNVKELAKIYSIADVFLNPTLEDNFPTTNLESLACGTPVITFNTGGSVESIDDSCGIIIEKGNINELIKAMRQISDNNYSIECCLERAKLFDKCKMLSNYEELYYGF